jgi:hypothetical protein
MAIGLRKILWWFPPGKLVQAKSYGGFHRANWFKQYAMVVSTGVIGLSKILR